MSRKLLRLYQLEWHKSAYLHQGQQEPFKSFRLMSSSVQPSGEIHLSTQGNGAFFLDRRR